MAHRNVLASSPMRWHSHAGVGRLLAVTGRATAALILIVGLLALAVLFTPVVNLLVGPLIVPESVGPSDVIVVLGGGNTSDGSLSVLSLQRVWYGVRLYRQGYAPYLLFSTGVTSTEPGAVAEARRMAEAAIGMGVPASSIVLEERSTRTVENAEEVARIVRSQSWQGVLLVTHPTHMRRAVATFQRAGVIVRPAPTDGGGDRAENPMERAALFFRVAYEYAAWILYWWKGWV